MKSDNI
jgi:hypothetical protein